MTFTITYSHEKGTTYYPFVASTIFDGNEIIARADSFETAKKSLLEKVQTLIQDVTIPEPETICYGEKITTMSDEDRKDAEARIMSYPSMEVHS